MCQCVIKIMHISCKNSSFEIEPQSSITINLISQLSSGEFIPPPILSGMLLLADRVAIAMRPLIPRSSVSRTPFCQVLRADSHHRLAFPACSFIHMGRCQMQPHHIFSKGGGSKACSENPPVRLGSTHLAQFLGLLFPQPVLVTNSSASFPPAPSPSLKAHNSRTFRFCSTTTTGLLPPLNLSAHIYSSITLKTL